MKKDKNKNLSNYRTRAFTDGRLVWAFNYFDLVTTDRMTEYMIQRYEQENARIEEIAEEIERTPEEVFLFLFDQGLRGNLKKPIAYRFI